MGYLKTMTFKERLAEGKRDSCTDTCGKSIPGPGNHSFRGIKVGACLDIQGTARKAVWLDQSKWKPEESA